jgi:hypothetical protein
LRARAILNGLEDWRRRLTPQSAGQGRGMNEHTLGAPTITTADSRTITKPPEW